MSSAYAAHTTQCTLCSSVSHVRTIGLIYGESVPCWSWLKLKQSSPVQGEGRDFWWQILIPVWGEGELGIWGKLRINEVELEKNEGRKDGDGRCGLNSPCSDAAPDWFSEHTGEWPFNSKPILSPLHTDHHQGTHTWEAWLIFYMCLQKSW